MVKLMHEFQINSDNPTTYRGFNSQQCDVILGYLLLFDLFNFLFFLPLQIFSLLSWIKNGYLMFQPLLCSFSVSFSCPSGMNSVK